jgi:hypothetical protein
MFILFLKNLNLYETQNNDDKISIVIIMFYNLEDGQEQNKFLTDNTEKLQIIKKKVDNQNL